MKNILKGILILLLIFILCVCKEENKSVITRDVLVNRTAYNYIHQLDSLAIEYTDIDSITQFVLRITYVRNRMYPDTIGYKLINKKTKAYLESGAKKTIYLDTETFNFVEGTFKDSVLNSGTTLLFKMFNAKFQYINSSKDSVNNMTYYIFRGRDVNSRDDSDAYWYFDSIFHLKKIYSIDKTLMFSVN